jgi:hypothetical protein
LEEFFFWKLRNFPTEIHQLILLLLMVRNLEKKHNTTKNWKEEGKRGKTRTEDAS